MRNERFRVRITKALTYRNVYVIQNLDEKL